MIVEDQTEVIEFLSDPEAYGPSIESVQHIDTHGAVVFLAGDRAYKLKRAVYFEYMDFSTLARREHCCRAELTLNSRTAPETYLGVLAVTREADGELAIDGAGNAVEWLVHMRRFEECGVLDKVALRGEFDAALAARVADMACDFLAAAEVRGEAGAADTIPDIVGETARLLPEGIGDLFSRQQVDELCAHQRELTLKMSTRLEARRTGGFVRHCHGDFHLRNVCLIEGRPTMFDAIEFNDRLAVADILYDLAFLLMDLIHRDLAGHANLILNRYLERLGDYGGIPLLPLYLSVRAGIRAFTAIPAAANQSDPEIARRVRQGAGEYLDLAQRFLEPARPRLVALGGLSGSGKSSQAKLLAPSLGGAIGAVVLRSDVLRKSLMGVGQTDRLGPAGYTKEVTAEVYQSLRAGAAELLAAGQSVVVDAVHAGADERRQIEALARQAGVAFDGLWLEAPAEVMAARLSARQGDASDATVEVLGRQMSYDLGEMTWPRLSPEGSPEDVAATVGRALRRPDQAVSAAAAGRANIADNDPITE